MCLKNVSRLSDVDLFIIALQCMHNIVYIARLILPDVCFQPTLPD